MKQKLFLLAIIMMIMEIPQSVMAYDFSYTYQGKTLYYNIINGNAEVTYRNSSSPRYTNLSGNLVIPNNVTYGGNTYSVTSINNNAFSGCINLTSVTIPTSITNIGNAAFSNCIGLTTVNFNATNCTHMGGSGSNLVFYNCTNFSTLVIGDSVTIIPDNAFCGRGGLTSVTLPNQVTSIGADAFSYCSSLNSVTIGNSVTYIGYNAFYECDSITRTNYTGNIAQWCNINFYEWYSNPISYSRNLYINNVEITNLVIPDSVTEIKQYAFIGLTNLTSVTIGNSVINIYESAFDGCSNLTTINIPNSVDYIRDFAFYYCCGLTSVVIGSSVTTIGIYAFSNCNNLDTVILLPEIAPTKYTSSFSDNARYRAFYIPCGSYNSYSDYYPRYEPEVDFGLTVLISNGGNASALSQHGRNVQCDSTAIIQAIANYGYHFDHWSNGNTANPDTLHLSGDSTVMAFFSPNQYTLTLYSSDESLGTVSGSGTYYYLDTVLITATPIEHYHLSYWSDYNNENPRHYVITGNGYLTAYFEIDHHSVTVTSSNIARGMVETTGTDFEYGQPCTVTATAYTGYTFAGWSNGITANPYTFAVLNDVELTALFVAEGEEIYTVTVASADPTMGTVSGGGQALDGGQVVIRAQSSPGYHFLRWNDNNTDSIRTVEVHGNITYTAYFEANLGIGYVEVINAKIYTQDGQIIVEGTDGNMVTLYDIYGRMLATKRNEYSSLRFDIPTSGTYLIKIGDYPARKVVVVR